MFLDGVLYQGLPVLNKSCLRKEPEWFPLKYLQERIDDFHRHFGLVLKNLKKRPSPPNFIAHCYEVLGIWDNLGEILGRASMRGIGSSDVVWVRKDVGKRIFFLLNKNSEAASRVNRAMTSCSKCQRTHIMDGYLTKFTWKSIECPASSLSFIFAIAMSACRSKLSKSLTLFLPKNERVIERWNLTHKYNCQMTEKRFVGVG